MNLITKLYEEGFNPFIASMIPSTVKSRSESSEAHVLQKLFKDMYTELKSFLNNYKWERLYINYFEHSTSGSKEALNKHLISTKLFYAIFSVNT
jgi:hypothetical protein